MRKEKKSFVIFNYPYHPDATFILLEVRGNAGDFGVTVTQMNGWGSQLQTLKGFELGAYEKLEQNYVEFFEMMN